MLRPAPAVFGSSFHENRTLYRNKRAAVMVMTAMVFIKDLIPGSF